MKKQKTKIWKKILLSLVGVVTMFTMTFASNFVSSGENVAYAITCYDSQGKATEISETTCPTGTTLEKPQEATSASKNEAIKEIVDKLNILQLWLDKAIWPVLMMIGGLLNNELIFSNGMDQKLYDIWVQIRNLVNIVFVIVLVGIALYSVLGISSEGSQYSIKTMLPKLIIAIIAVNFSFLGVKVILDATTVVTTAIFAIPNTESVLDTGDKKMVNKVCEKMYGLENGSDGDKLKAKIDDLVYMSFAKTGAGEGVINDQMSASQIKAAIEAGDENLKKAFSDYKQKSTTKVYCEGLKDGSLGLTSTGKAFFNQFKSNNAAMAMAINMGGLLYLDLSSGVNMGSGVMELAISIIFSTVFYVVYMFAFLTLFLVLIARLAVVWISLAFSPVLVLGLAIPGVAQKVEMFKTIQDSFVKHVTAPIIIAIAMSVGWVMLNTLSGTGFTTNSQPNAVLSSAIPGLPIPGLETIQSLIAAACTAAVVWLGATSAAKGTLAAGAVEAVGGVIKKAGTFVAKAPFLYTPVLPIQIQDKDGTYRNATLAEAGLGIRRKIENMEQKTREGGDAFARQVLGVVGDTYTLGDLNDSTSRDDATRILANVPLDTPEARKALKEKVKKAQNNNAKWYTDIKNSTDYPLRDALNAVANSGENGPSAAQVTNLQRAAKAAVPEAEAPAAKTQSKGGKSKGSAGERAEKEDEKKTTPSNDPVNVAIALGVNVDNGKITDNDIRTELTAAKGIIDTFKIDKNKTELSGDEAKKIATTLKKGNSNKNAQIKAAEALVSGLDGDKKTSALEAINTAIEAENKPATTSGAEASGAATSTSP